MFTKHVGKRLLTEGLTVNNSFDSNRKTEKGDVNDDRNRKSNGK